MKGLERNGVSLLFKIIPQKIKNSYYMIQSLHCWVCNRRKWNHCLGERPAPPCPQPKCPSTDEWMKVWHKHEHRSPIKEEEILPSATTWVDLDGTVLCEMSQKEKVKHQMITHVKPKKPIQKQKLKEEEIGFPGWETNLPSVLLGLPAPQTFLRRRGQRALPNR